MTEDEIAEHNRQEQGRYKFLILGIYSTGHGITERWIAPADVLATMAAIRRNGAEPMIASVFKDGAPIESWDTSDFPGKVSFEPIEPSALPEFGIVSDARKGIE